MNELRGRAHGQEQKPRGDPSDAARDQQRTEQAQLEASALCLCSSVLGQVSHGKPKQRSASAGG